MRQRRSRFNPDFNDPFHLQTDDLYNLLQFDDFPVTTAQDLWLALKLKQYPVRSYRNFRHRLVQFTAKKRGWLGSTKSP